MHVFIARHSVIDPAKHRGSRTGTERPAVDAAGVVVYDNGRAIGGIDAIDEYSRRLVTALSATGLPVSYLPDGANGLREMGVGAPWVLLQYNPLSYGRWGFAPLLLRHVIALRQRAATRFVLSVHEPWVNSYNWRSAIMNRYQRVQLIALMAAADAIVTTTESLATRLQRGAVPIPVGTNITPVPIDRGTAKDRLALGDRFVVALFGRAHPSRALTYADRAISELCGHLNGRRVTVLNLGDGTPEPVVPPNVEVRSPGRQLEEDLSLALRASDILLLPFRDGVSARRTTLMAGLAHAVPIAGLWAWDSDRAFLADDALVLTPVGDVTAYTRAVVALAASPDRLEQVGRAGRRLYEQHFAWPVVARRVIDVVCLEVDGCRTNPKTL